MSGPSVSSVSGNADDGRSHSQMLSQGSSSLQPPSNIGAKATDPASSLRAAALLTLKSKRKKPLSDSDPSGTHPLRTRAPAQLTLQLDYGQEDSSSTALPPRPGSLATATTSQVPSTEADDKLIAREEGEISDSEVAKLQPSAKKDSKKSKKVDNATKSSDSPLKPAQPADSEKTLVKTEPGSPSIARFRVDPVSSPGPSTPPRQVQLAPEQPVFPQPIPFAIDENHVRPGLAMSQHQYDTAKDIVLDLLGWGVPPEYLVDCGLSREIVFYVFTELRLRLPPNFDATGIPPYTQELLQSIYQDRLPPNLDPLPVGKLLSRSHTYPQLPSKPITPQGLASSPTHPSLSANATPFLPFSLTQNGNSPSLLDIEQQRRRELLARKAVLASRKAKQPQARRTPSLSPSPTASSVNEPIKDIEMAPAETVDDFLNSIGPVDDQTKPPVDQAPEAVDASKSSNPPPQISTPNAMDVDEIPGFVTSEGSGNWSTLASASTLSSVQTPPSSNDDISSTSAGELASANSYLSNASFSSHQGNMLPPRSDGNYIDTLNGDDVSSAPRRGTKRPVAADFVDYESESTPGSNGYGGHAAPPFSRRKLGSFASVSGMRRCVIDLSDSEDDGLEDNALYRNSAHSPYPVPPRQSSWLVPAMGASISGTSTPPFASIGAQPAALLEKEQEIKRMREMIAQREQNRLRKLVMSSRTTPVHSPSSMSIPGAGVDAPSLSHRSYQSGSTTPVNEADEDASANVNGHEPGGVQDSEEDAVMNGILSTPSTATDPNFAEGSDCATPIDVVSNTLKHSITGDKVLTDEAQQEEAIDERGDAEALLEETDGLDVDDVVGLYTSSTQGGESQNQNSEDQAAARNRWTIYNSPLDSYPLLRSQVSIDAGVAASKSLSSSSSQATLFSMQGISPSSSSTSVSSISIDWPDLKPLKLAVARQSFDSEKRICQFEVPGGGECRDAQCEDMHIGRVSSIEPTDEDTAQYLFNTLSADFAGQEKPSVKVIKDALEDVRRKKGLKMVFDDRVSIALSMLELR